MNAKTAHESCVCLTQHKAYCSSLRKYPIIDDTRAATYDIGTGSTKSLKIVPTSFLTRLICFLFDAHVLATDNLVLILVVDSNSPGLYLNSHVATLVHRTIVSKTFIV